MIDLEYWEKRSQEEILEEIKKKSELIVKLKKTANSTGFKTYGGALGLQDLERDRKSLQSLLEPLKLVADCGGDLDDNN